MHQAVAEKTGVSTIQLHQEGLVCRRCANMVKTVEEAVASGLMKIRMIAMVGLVMLGLAYAFLEWMWSESVRLPEMRFVLLLAVCAVGLCGLPLVHGKYGFSRRALIVRKLCDGVLVGCAVVLLGGTVSAGVLTVSFVALWMTVVVPGDDLLFFLVAFAFAALVAVVSYPPICFFLRNSEHRDEKVEFRYDIEESVRFAADTLQHMQAGTLSRFLRGWVKQRLGVR